MEKLHQDIRLDIFSRLPAESILHCKQVCKSWLSILKDPSFAQIHLHRQLILLHQHLNNDDPPDGCSTATPVPCGGGGGGSVEFGFILLAALDDSHSGKLLYRKYDENDEQSYQIVKKINHPLIKTTVGMSAIMIGSCNGLICLAIPSGNDIGDPTYIFNPITREHVNLPRLCERYIKQRCNTMSGFGYHPSTNEYKVVRIFYPDYKEGLAQVQVYTLGAGSGWRDKGKVAYTFWSIFGVRGTHANGKLYWMVGEGEIVAFDLADEEFHFIPSPPIVYLDGWRDRYGVYSRRLCVLGGWLGLAHHVSVMGGSSHIDIWLLKKKSTSGYDMNKQEHECWSKEFTIPMTDYNYNISLLALTKRGEVLFWGVDFKYYLCRYDPKSATRENLELGDGKKFGFTEAVPHINSFVSLKALGEKSWRKIKYMRKYCAN